MSGLEVVGAVSAVVSAFHGGAELVAHIKKKHRKRKSEQAYKEKQLQESLQTGETQVDQRYANDCRELGQYMRKGDTIARDRLLHITVCMQAEIIRSLQLAVKYENAILDLTVLLEASIMNRKETMTTLDELRQRILVTQRPIDRALAPPALEAPNSRSSFESVQSFRTANPNPVPDTYLPPAITIPDEPEMKSGLGRFLSNRRTSSRQHRPTTSVSNMSFTPSLGYLEPAIQEHHGRTDLMNDINDTMSSFQGLQIDAPRRDTLAQLQFPQPPSDLTSNEFLNQAMLNNYGWSAQPSQTQNAFNRNNSTSTTYSENPPPSITSHSSKTSSSSPAPSSVPTFSNRTSLNSAPSPVEPDPQSSSFNPGYRPTSFPVHHTHSNSFARSTPSPRADYRSSTISMPSIASQQNMMVGRPCKDNNYWGFCKGAWGCREEPKKGLSLQTRPEGLYSTVSIWQCKHCLFQGDTYALKPPPGSKKKKIETTVNPNIHVSAVGIKYRWIFLAKSHVKKKNASGKFTGTEDQCNYGCLFCCAEGKGTGIYGNVETLMNHIFLEHAKGLSEGTALMNRCVIGRDAGIDEEWDICIPSREIIDDGAGISVGPARAPALTVGRGVAGAVGHGRVFEVGG